MKECDILGVRTYSNPSSIFSGGHDPHDMTYAADCNADRVLCVYCTRVVT